MSWDCPSSCVLLFSFPQKLSANSCELADSFFLLSLFTWMTLGVNQTADLLHNQASYQQNPPPEAEESIKETPLEI